MKKQYKSSITKNHKIKKKYFFERVPLKSYVALSYFLHLAPEIKKNIVGKSSD